MLDIQHTKKKHPVSWIRYRSRPKGFWMPWTTCQPTAILFWQTQMGRSPHLQWHQPYLQQWTTWKGQLSMELVEAGNDGIYMLESCFYLGCVPFFLWPWLIFYWFRYRWKTLSSTPHKLSTDPVSQMLQFFKLRTKPLCWFKMSNNSLRLNYRSCIRFGCDQRWL